jgi:hypothetical protein
MSRGADDCCPTILENKLPSGSDTTDECETNVGAITNK